MKNNNWEIIKVLTVPNILKMLPWKTKIDDGKKIIYLPESTSESIDTWKIAADSVRKSGIDNPEINDQIILGTHKDMNSPGEITIYGENIGKCFWCCITELLAKKHTISPLDLRRLCEAAVFQVFAHEQFHHYCDAIQRLTGHRGIVADEEALAVAWEWYEVQRSLPSVQKLPPTLFSASLSWWYDSITALGYKDWNKFDRICCFKNGLTPHLIPSANDHILSKNGCNLGDWLYQMIDHPDWCADAVRYYVEVSLGDTHLETISGDITNFDTYCKGANIKIVDKYEGDLILCGNKISSLKDIHTTIKKIKGYICLRNNPIISNILGILLIDGCYKVYLDNKDVQDIINEYLPNKEGRKNVMKCKAKLVDAKFEEYAQL